MRIPFLTTNRRIATLEGLAIVETEDDAEAMGILARFQRENPGVTVKSFSFDRPDATRWSYDKARPKRLVISWKANIDLGTQP
jgi:hypothetical protein